MDYEAKKPLAPQALLDYLERCFPLVSPTEYHSLSDREVSYRMGQTRVVEKLKADIKAAQEPREE